MEEELKCPACRQFLRDPLLLQCAHSYCRDCALAAQVKITSSNALSVNNMSSGINPTSNYANFSPLSPPCSSNSGVVTIDDLNLSERIFSHVKTFLYIKFLYFRKLVQNSRTNIFTKSVSFCLRFKSKMKSQSFVKCELD